MQPIKWGMVKCFMSNSVFIIADSIVVSEMVFSINYLLNINFSQIYLLGENAREDRFSPNANSKIIISNNVDYCIEKCNYIIIVRSSSFPQKSINRISKKVSASKTAKKLFVLDDFDETPSTNYFDKISTIVDVYHNTPVVLCLASGYHAQQIRTELILHEIFRGNGVSFCQFYSCRTFRLIQQLMAYGLLNSSLNALDSTICSEQKIIYNLFIVSIDFDDNINNLRDYSAFLNIIKPDFIILQTGDEYDQCNAWDNAVSFLCGSEIDMKVKSSYRRFDRDIITYVDNKHKEDMFYYLEKKNYKDVLEKQLFTKMSFPEGVISVF